MGDFFRPFLDELKEYVPGKNPEKKGVIKLASNENPFGPSKKAVEAIEKELKNLHIYPDQKSSFLRIALAEKFLLPHENIILGNGSDDIMGIIGATFLNPGEEVIITENSFSIYSLVSKIFGGKIVSSPLNDFKTDVKDILSKISAKTKMIFLTNPHNPTGTYITQDELNLLLINVPESVLVVLDEAYAEFSEAKDFPDSISEIRRGRKNLVVLRTFSKFYGLAGLRVGYGFSSKENISFMMKTKMPFNVSRPAQAGALAALGDKSFLEKTYQNNVEIKNFFYSSLGAMGLSYKKTESNFIFIETPVLSDEIFLKMMSFGVIIRPLSSFGIPSAVRVSFGTKDQTKIFFDAFKKAVD